MIRVSITHAHGTFTTTTSALDLMISRHLPASPEQLRRVLNASTDAHLYDDLRDVSELLIMLADAEGYAFTDDNHVTSASNLARRTRT
jgi:hypothetical protein